MRAIPDTKTLLFGFDFPVSTYSGELELIPLFSSHHSITLPL
jgi:hypothetical protein